MQLFYNSKIHYLFKVLASILLGCLLGCLWLAQSPHWLALLILVPVIWFIMPNRWLAALFIFCYKLIPSLGLFGAFHRFLPDNSLWFISVLVMITIIFQTIPWLALHPKAHWKIAIRYSLLFILLIILILPPFGTTNWVTPFNSIGYLFPGFGWWGVLLALLSVISLTLLCKRKFTLSSSIVCITLLIVSLSTNLSYKTVPPPPHWVAISTNMPSWFKQTKQQQIARESKLITQVHQAIQSKHKVIILPEGTVLIWGPKTKKYWHNVIADAQRHNAIIILGAENLHPWFKQNEGYFVIKQSQSFFYPTRQPMPYVSWNPFQPYAPKATWFKNMTLNIHNQPTLISVCYEDTLVFTNLYPFIGHPKPQVIISIANLWWATNNILMIQRHAIESWTRLFNISLLHAVNRPTS